MYPIFKILYLTMCFALIPFLGFSQGNTNTIKAQLALGVNSPSSGGFVDDFEANGINLPTVNLGLQYMFKPLLGAKLDFGFNRFSNANDTPEFKINYSRINVQLVYDARKIFTLENRMGIFAHLGPGYSIVKPLGDFSQNNTSFLNAMGGIEFHYGISDNLSLYLDTAYILGFGKDFSPVSDGFGSFNGNLLTITFGVSISLSGCYFCED